MKVLVACEYSGIVRDAFLAKGHDAISCDLLATESPGPHYQGDVFDIINDGFDLMVAFPPCTYITYAATAYWDNPGRAKLRLEALMFFNQLLTSDIPKICIENPQGCADAVIRKADQVVNPYYFGEPQLKRTQLWLKNLPPLKYRMHDDLFGERTATDKPKPTFVDKKGKKRYFTDAQSGGNGSGTSFKKRSKFWPVIAAAMADQWG
jgi:hypothetical protein